MNEASKEQSPSAGRRRPNPKRPAPQAADHRPDAADRRPQTANREPDATDHRLALMFGLYVPAVLASCGQAVR